MTADFGGYLFEFVCSIMPERGVDGAPIEYMPQSKYKNNKGLSLHKYGKGPFCRFSIPTRWRGKEGVYLLVVNGEVKYVGECEDLAKRFNVGYGNISPRNCFEGGQQTNCRINHEIFILLKKNASIDLFFFETSNRFRVESKLISLFSPEWNKSSGRKRPVIQKTSPVHSSRPKFPTGTSCRDEILSAAHQIVSMKGVNEFTVREVLDFLKERGTQYSNSTIRTHITSRCCSNAPDHHAVVYHDFERIGRGRYRVIN